MAPTAHVIQSTGVVHAIHQDGQGSTVTNNVPRGSMVIAVIIGVIVGSMANVTRFQVILLFNPTYS